LLCSIHPFGFGYQRLAQDSESHRAIAEDVDGSPVIRKHDGALGIPRVVFFALDLFEWPATVQTNRYVGSHLFSFLPSNALSS